MTCIHVLKYQDWESICTYTLTLYSFYYFYLSSTFFFFFYSIYLILFFSFILLALLHRAWKKVSYHSSLKFVFYSGSSVDEASFITMDQLKQEHQNRHHSTAVTHYIFLYFCSPPPPPNLFTPLCPVFVCVLFFVFFLVVGGDKRLGQIQSFLFGEGRKFACWFWEQHNSILYMEQCREGARDATPVIYSYAGNLAPFTTQY